MSAAKKISQEEKDLMRRYLVWFYKTAKESVDRIDRKFTQSTVDRFVLAQLGKGKGKVFSDPAYVKQIEDFKVYISRKEDEGKEQKFIAGTSEINPQYAYLRNRLIAVEAAIRHFLGVKELSKIVASYEQEMTRRILESKEH